MRDPLWSNLPSAAREVADWVKREHGTIGEAMWPTLGPQPKPATNSDRESLLRHLKEANARIDARLQKEGKRR
jgi:hypothetical protein